MVRRAGAGYLVTAPDDTETAVADLGKLVEFADAIYERVWTGQDRAERLSEIRSI